MSQSNVEDRDRGVCVRGRNQILKVSVYVCGGVFTTEVERVTQVEAVDVPPLKARR